MRIICITPIKHIDGLYENLSSIGQVDYHPEIDKISLQNLVDLYDYNIIFCNPNKQNYILNEYILNGFNGTIITASTGLNHIDIKYCNEKKIDVVSLTTHYDVIEKISSTAEHSFALMMSLLRNIPSSFDDVKKNTWDYEKFIGRQLDNLTIGIIGYGRLGTMMERYCKAFGMRVLIHDPYKGYDNLQNLVKESDIITLHVHVSDETKYMINKKLLTHMKQSSYIINTSRGEIVDEKAIIESLRDNHLKGYATDVIEDEFDNIKNSPILKGIDEGLNIIVTPHIAGMTKEAQEIAYNGVVDKYKDGRTYDRPK